MTRRAVILGAPGAGKGTQAQRVCAELDLVHLSTGDLLRAAVAAGTPAGREAKGHMEAGRLVPDEVVFGVLFERLGQRLDSYLLDGFPRNRAQAEELDRRLRVAGEQLDVVVEIAVPDARLVGRITGRRICGGCGRNYHIDFVPPAKEGSCDACGGALLRRADDDEQIVQERLAVYHRQTAPLIKYYEQRGILTRVDGDKPVERVTAAVLEALASDIAERA